ncbi:MAG: polysaccharide biosynthesis/export family protein [Bacteroidota bacterium]
MKKYHVIMILTAGLLFLQESVLSAQPGNYVINKGDVLDIAVMEHPEFSVGGIIVLPDGTLQYPGFGSIMAAGMTTGALKDTLEKALEKYVVNPLVTVFVQTIRNEKLNIFGYVNQPGQYQVFEEEDLFTVLSMAGGIVNIKKAGKIIIIRRDRTVEVIHLKKYLGKRGMKAEVPAVGTGDTVYVKEPGQFNWAIISFFSTLVLAVTNVLVLLL